MRLHDAGDRRHHEHDHRYTDMKVKRKRQPVFKRLGLVLVWLGVLALLVPSYGDLPNPSWVLLPLGVTLYTLGWIRD